jgi:hypothetical protein
MSPIVEINMRRRRFNGLLYRCVARQRERGTRKVWQLDEKGSHGTAPLWIGTSTWERGGIVLSYDDIVHVFNSQYGSWDVDPAWRRTP